MGKKGGKKAKGPTYYVEDDHCLPFGFRANDIIKTPLGLTGTVIGVKYENPDLKETGRLWVLYDGGKEAPIENPQAQTAEFPAAYRRSTEGSHIWRDVTRIRAQMKVIEEARAIADRYATVRMEALNLESAKGAAKGAKAAAKGRPATAA
mmetsp:Transcript_31140/g.77505  ORF Transcript_31140/g.77505 Transcript_31140/m.77505 type:complete len:150 (-) Transcript_31140:192-641(-)|eukprot:CAMPEP_0197576002 /NCGR_PEP_ID=MMETSP1326-20131121/1184_1 /TAXON_ID=1155430 /ORGANISM="Genus nov. species nov., Strain RCC2288" /LENGTH=149 /DNA_ID=CAMNT_0043138851 /DNA_START=459 /DNA_END=908 /DNA_ORIENTATION=+